LAHEPQGAKNQHNRHHPTEKWRPGKKPILSECGAGREDVDGDGRRPERGDSVKPRNGFRALSTLSSARQHCPPDMTLESYLEKKRSSGLSRSAKLEIIDASPRKIRCTSGGRPHSAKVHGTPPRRVLEGVSDVPRGRERSAPGHSKRRSRPERCAGGGN